MRASGWTVPGGRPVTVRAEALGAASGVQPSEKNTENNVCQ